MSRWMMIVVGVAVLAAAAGGLGWWALRDATPPLPPATVPPAERADDEPGSDAASTAPAQTPDPTDAGPSTPPAPVELPPLDASDDFVRERVATDDAPLLAAWLENEGLVHLAATLLANAAQGKLPKRMLTFVQVQGKFAVAESDGVVVVDEASYRRYDAAVEALLGVPPARVARLFAIAEPLVAESLAELGIEEPNPKAMLDAAIVHVLETPVPAKPVALEHPSVFYKFADAKLEALSPLQKHLLRTGPRNMARIQDYARELRALL